MYVEGGVVEQAAYTTGDVSRPVRHSTPALLHTTHKGQAFYSCSTPFYSQRSGNGSKLTTCFYIILYFLIFTFGDGVKYVFD